MKQVMLLIVVSLFLMGSCSAYLEHEQNTSFNLTVSSNNATSCNLSYIQYNDGESVIFNHILTQDIRTFSTTISETNFSELGNICMHVICTDGIKYEDGSQCRIVTLSGKVVDVSIVTAHIALLSFFLILIIGFFLVTKNVDLNTWHNSIIKKYQHRNYVKLVLSSILFNVIKNKFIVYYLAGLPVLLLLTDMVYRFSLDGMMTLMTAIFYIYLIGITIVGIVFLSNMQEWIVDSFNQIKDMEYGVE